MTEQELRELEQLAKAAMKQNPGESQDILEQALQERKQEMWDAIQKKARRRVQMRKARPWTAAAAVVMMAVVISGAIGVNQARAGKEGLLVDIVEGVAGDIDIAFSEEPADFVPAMIENGTWDEITGAIDDRFIDLLPKDMPPRYEFFNGTYDKLDYNMQELWLMYLDTVGESTITIQYNISAKNEIGYKTDIDPDIMNGASIDKEEWHGVTVYLVGGDDNNRLMWSKDHIVIAVVGEINKRQMREVFNSINK